MKKRIGRILFVFLLLILTVPPWAIWAQATAGYTKINATTRDSKTFTTGTLTNGSLYNFEVTAVDANTLESKPSNIISQMIPTDGKSHMMTLSWTDADATVTFNVYQQIVSPPNPPGALTGVLN